MNSHKIGGIVSMMVKKGYCQACGLAGETELYTATGPVDIVTEEGIKEIGFVVVPVQELCPICATLEGVADPETMARVSEYTDLMKISVETPDQVGLVGPTSHPTLPEKLTDILVSRDVELEGRSGTAEVGRVRPAETALSPEEWEWEEEILPEGLEEEEEVKLTGKEVKLLKALLRLLRD